MNAIIEQCRRLGVRLRVEGGALAYDAPGGALTPELIAGLKANKPAILAALAHPGPLPRLPRGLGGYGTPPGVPPLGDSELARQVRSMSEDGQPEPLWWRVSITDPGGRTVEVDTPSGWTLSEWAAYTLRYYGPGCAVTAIAGLPKPRAPVNLDEALRTACDDVAGITPARFRTLLSPEDVKDIEGGGIHRKTLKGYAESSAEGMRSGRIAAKPAPSAAVAITEAEIEAARKGRPVVRQGTFSGAPEVKA